MTTKTAKTITNGTDCTDLFHIWNGEVPSVWAEQRSNEDARSLIHVVLNTDGIPCEGSVGDKHYLSFKQETTGLGFEMHYEVGPEDDMGFVRIHAVRVYRDDRWDDEPVDPDEGFEMQVDDEYFDHAGESAPAVTFDTAEEYEAQCQRCTEDGIRIAAEKVWKEAVAEVERFWAHEDRLRMNGRLPIRGLGRTMQVLQVYKNVLEVLGYELTVERDGLDACKRIFSLRSAFGYVRAYDKLIWKI